jgi:hypothetical protein
MTRCSAESLQSRRNAGSDGCHQTPIWETVGDEVLVTETNID